MSFGKVGQLRGAGEYSAAQCLLRPEMGRLVNSYTVGIWAGKRIHNTTQRRKVLRTPYLPRCSVDSINHQRPLGDSAQLPWLGGWPILANSTSTMLQHCAARLWARYQAPSVT